MNDPLLVWRKEFPTLQHSNYLISNSLGAMPSSVRNRMLEYAEFWETKGVHAWEELWWEMPMKVGEEIAPLIGARSGEVVMLPNSTTMLAVILSSLEGEVRKRRKSTIVCEELNFPSLLYLCREWGKTNNVGLRLVPSEDGISVDTGRMIEAIDEETLIVPMSHVLFKSAYVQDVRAIVERARAVGAYVLLDAYQSVGTIPVDVRELDVDFLIGGVLKWLCGGPGGGYLYVRPELSTRLKPRLTGWLAHTRPFDFEKGEMEYSKTMYRFLNGTPSIPSLYAATEGPRILKKAGIQAIREKSVRQTSLIVDEARRRNWDIRSPIESTHRGGTVTLDVPHGFEVVQELAARNIQVDYRKDAGIRIAPHFYTTDEEIADALNAISLILEEASWKRHEGKTRTVT